jgi:hypothetical protein
VISICANLARHFFEPRDIRANKSPAWGCAGDQAETFLHRQRFSSGPIGLACMRTKTALSHLCADHAPQLQSIVALRPFLGFEKEDLQRYCQQNLVPWVEDPTNRDPAFARTRNRVDLQGVPWSQARYPCIAIVYWAVRLSSLRDICGVEPGTPARSVPCHGSNQLVSMAWLLVYMCKKTCSSHSRTTCTLGMRSTTKSSSM